METTRLDFHHRAQFTVRHPIRRGKLDSMKRGGEGGNGGGRSIVCSPLLKGRVYTSSWQGGVDTDAAVEHTPTNG